MTEELKQKAKDYANKWLWFVKDLEMERKTDPKPEYIRIEEAYIAGATENGIQWHKVTDWKNQEQFPNDELKNYLVYINLKYLKIKQYVVCDLDITEGFRQFYLDDGDDYIDPEDIIAWCEIPQFTEDF